MRVCVRELLGRLQRWQLLDRMRGAIQFDCSRRNKRSRGLLKNNRVGPFPIDFSLSHTNDKGASQALARPVRGDDVGGHLGDKEKERLCNQKNKGIWRDLRSPFFFRFLSSGCSTCQMGVISSRGRGQTSSRADSFFPPSNGHPSRKGLTFCC